MNPKLPLTPLSPLTLRCEPDNTTDVSVCLDDEILLCVCSCLFGVWLIYLIAASCPLRGVKHCTTEYGVHIRMLSVSVRFESYSQGDESFSQGDESFSQGVESFSQGVESDGVPLEVFKREVTTFGSLGDPKGCGGAVVEVNEQ